MHDPTRRQILASLGALSALALTPSMALAAGGLREGSMLPPLRLSTLDGKTVELPGAIKGRVALLNFWATWCGPCIQELPALDSLHRKLADNDGVVVQAINVDQGVGLSFLSDFWLRYQLALPLLVDAAGNASRSYRLSVLPMSYIVDRNGQIRYALQGARNWGSDQWVRGLAGMAAEGKDG
jgi:thiol-disulfide isomerase/thioredoxin